MTCARCRAWHRRADCLLSWTDHELRFGLLRRKQPHNHRPRPARDSHHYARTGRNRLADAACAPALRRRPGGRAMQGLRIVVPLTCNQSSDRKGAGFFPPSVPPSFPPSLRGFVASSASDHPRRCDVRAGRATSQLRRTERPRSRRFETGSFHEPLKTYGAAGATQAQSISRPRVLPSTGSFPRVKMGILQVANPFISRSIRQ